MGEMTLKGLSLFFHVSVYTVLFFEVNTENDETKIINFLCPAM